MKKAFFKKVSNHFTKLFLNIKQQLGLLGSPRIIPFMGFGSARRTFIVGEVMEDNGISKPKEGQSKWQNIKAMIKRYLSNEIENVRVKVSFLGKNQVVRTDRHGVFQCFFNHEELAVDDGWHKYSVQLLDSFGGKFSSSETEGEVLIINKNPQFGVVSDIDDTIILSFATRKLMKFRLLLLNNAYTRMPFEGVSAFYNALKIGTKPGPNPIFYLSNSDWNLYDLLYEFIEFNRIPKGPLLLRQLGFRFFRSKKKKDTNRNHKYDKLVQLFSLYPEMKFILIGDSGQNDTQVYSGIVKEFPARVLAIYIRDVGVKGKVANIKMVSKKMFDEFKVEMVLVKDTEAAASHALKKGYISSGQFPAIINEKKKDLLKKNEPERSLV